eukprot:CAMPEP_0172313968 /NCGR_PEP_ID=MMETSP1058-20130122/21363_1 /TAXON_ID=83371 /ORGANISM="Detonula confervacea, Strain CCMP 353" /LENGTH=351 /DNA_ID=CAMNT_0013027711 /DNA_START=220 /DNA_END=1275 /DNA_ORIENTATION=+
MSNAADDAQYRQPSETDSENLGDDSAGVEQGTCDYDEIVATPDMCHHCFDALLKDLLPESALLQSHRGSAKRKQTNKTASQKLSDDHVDGNMPDFDDMREKMENDRTYTPPAVDCPLFVTWSKLRSSHPPLLSEVSSSGIATPATTTASSSNITDDDTSTQHDEADYDLRGCIGTLAPKSLKYALSEFAITSALHDNRFDPITLQELPFLRVGVSLLVKYEECKDCFDWVVGVHGIIIKFESVNRGKGIRERAYSATYLPEVAYEQRWSQQEAVVSLVRKAGYRGVITDDLFAQILCTRYQSSKYRLSYKEYAMSRHNGLDPLQNVNIMTTAAVGEAMRQKVKTSKPCVHL